MFVVHLNLLASLLHTSDRGGQFLYGEIRHQLLQHEQRNLKNNRTQQQRDQSKAKSMNQSKTEILDAPLHALGFEIDELSADKVSGHLLITSKCCQVLTHLMLIQFLHNTIWIIIKSILQECFEMFFAYELGKCKTTQNLRGMSCNLEIQLGFSVIGRTLKPFNMLHGGVSALIAEALASIGAHIAAGFHRVAGIQLSINHLKSAVVGDYIFAEATPLNVGKSIQVWEVVLLKCDPSKSEIKTMIASSRVTVLCNLPVPESARDAAQNLRKYAKL
ncbi:hypothetical protein OROGR_013300 [Orobanche gracilis]